jgi:hypothetical protein
MRLRACLHVAPHVGAVCTVLDADLRDVLSLLDSLRVCCDERAKVIRVLAARVAQQNAALDAELARE